MFKSLLLEASCMDTSRRLLSMSCGHRYNSRFYLIHGGLAAKKYCELVTALYNYGQDERFFLVPFAYVYLKSRTK